LLPEFRDLFAEMDELSRTLWFAVNEENELMSFIVGPGETPDLAMPRYIVKLLAVAAALESLPCAATEQRNIAEPRHMAVHVSTSWPAEKVTPEGGDYLSDFAQISPGEFSQLIDELYKQTLQDLRSEGAI
jgi:hypothetical protein